jgi:hypothetical protein
MMTFRCSIPNGFRNRATKFIASLLLILCVSPGEVLAAMPTEKCYWVMEHGTPDWGVRIWYPAELQDHKDCEKYTEALALADVINITLAIQRRERRFRMRKEDDGFLLIEYLSDPKSDGGERRLGRDEIIHYHGVYVDLETTKELIRAIANQPMGLSNATHE